jgi:spore germination protein YaaH
MRPASITFMMKHIYSIPLHFLSVTIALGGLFCLIPAPTVSAASDLEVAGWIPYWRDSEGIKDAKKHLDDIDVVYPFAFTVSSDGSINDQAGLESKEWKSFRKTAHKEDVLVIPTVMWSGGESIHAVLSNPTQRALHIGVIAHMVEEGDYDGVDIDYEGKMADTIDHFSAFLVELKEEIGNKMLSCTIEARTPPESLYKEIPSPLRYANDYDVIGDVCDRVVIMAYDQQRADIKLNAERTGAPYMPVADVDWVEKVVKLALKDIPNEKLVLGIPTYGHHWAITVLPDWYRDYRKIGALNLPDILDVAKDYKAKPSRNAAGEMSYTYLPKNSKVKLTSSLKIPKGTPSGNIVAARALAYANKTGEEVTFNIVWYSDAGAVGDKVDLAEEYDLRGISLFKIDGEEDQKIWRLF